MDPIPKLLKDPKRNPNKIKGKWVHSSNRIKIKMIIKVKGYVWSVYNNNNIILVQMKGQEWYVCDHEIYIIFIYLFN